MINLIISKHFYSQVINIFVEVVNKKCSYTKSFSYSIKPKRDFFLENRKNIFLEIEKKLEENEIPNKPRLI